MLVITSEHVLERAEPLSPSHTQFSSVQNNILTVIFQKDLAPPWIFKEVATQSNYLLGLI